MLTADMSGRGVVPASLLCVTLGRGRRLALAVPMPALPSGITAGQETMPLGRPLMARTRAGYIPGTRPVAP